MPRFFRKKSTTHSSTPSPQLNDSSPDNRTVCCFSNSHASKSVTRKGSHPTVTTSSLSSPNGTNHPFMMFPSREASSAWCSEVFTAIDGELSHKAGSDEKHSDFVVEGGDPSKVSGSREVKTIEIMRKKLRDVEELVNQKDTFIKNGKSSNVELSYLPLINVTPRIIASGELWIEHSFDLCAVHNCLGDITKSRSKWDSDFLVGEYIKDKDFCNSGNSFGEETIAQVWCAFKGRLGFPGRDFCWIQYTRMNSDKTELYFVITSIPVGSEPEGYKPGQKGSHVRAFTALGGYKFTVVKDKGIHVHFFNQTDLGGHLPDWIIDSVIKKSPAKLEYLRKFIIAAL